MVKEKERMMVDISRLKACGEVLDLGYKSSGIIYRALKKSVLSDETAVASDFSMGSDTMDWTKGFPDELPFLDNKFNMAVSFFSICLIDKRRESKKAIEEVARVLKEDGKFFIWDINIKHISLGLKQAIKVKLPGEEFVDMDFTSPAAFSKRGFKTLLPVIELYFDIKDKKDFDRYFYIEAVKKNNR